MKIHAVALVLTGFGLLSACGAAGLSDSASGKSASQKDSSVSIPEAKTDQTAAQADTASSEEMPVNAYSLPDLLSFTARTLEGGSFSASDLSGADLTVINIWSTTCGPCIREMPELAEFASGLPENIRVMTWCIDAEYSPDGGQVAQFLDDCGFTGVTLTSGDGDMQVLLDNLMYTPTTVFLDSTGHLLSEPLIGAGDIEAKYTEQINAGLRKLGKDTI